MTGQFWGAIEDKEDEQAFFVQELRRLNPTGVAGLSAG